MFLKRLLFVLPLVCFFCGGPTFATQDGQIAPPEVRLIDPLGANLVSRHSAASLETVSIGGERGLTHGLTVHASHFSTSGADYGYVDRYAGTAMYVELGQYIAIPHGSNFVVSVMRVFGPLGQQDFQVLVNGQYINHLGTDKVYTGYSYQALGDSRHTLTLVPGTNDLLWTLPDGTELVYERYGTDVHATSQGALRRIIYPNGLTLYIKFGNVTTNTGFQLKYIYRPETQGLSAEKQAIRATLLSNPLITLDTLGFAAANPKYIYAINRAVEYCSSVDNSDSGCPLTGDWPKATFTWPGGMPLAIYLGDSVFKVEDASGAATEFHYRSHDLMLLPERHGGGYAQDSNGTYYPYEPRQIWSPRLVGIKSAGSTSIDRQYEYENRLRLRSVGYGATWDLLGQEGALTRASGPQGSVVYADVPRAGGYDAVQAQWYHGLYVVEPLPSYPGKISRAQLPKEGDFRFESSYRNFVSVFYPLSGPTKRYHYDSRGNLTQIEEEAQNEIRTITAGYPTTCTNPKTCNKALWIQDARGQRTDYQYDADSGQVTKVTGPANIHGIRPQTRYEYDNYYATYYRDTNAPTDKPLRLLKREAYCRTTAASGNGCAGGAIDEVVKKYYYGPQNGTPNNLLLRGVSVTAEGSTPNTLSTQVTCYEYDIYGNQIGVTSPKGSLGLTDASACP